MFLVHQASEFRFVCMYKGVCFGEIDWRTVLWASFITSGIFISTDCSFKGRGISFGTRCLGSNGAKNCIAKQHERRGWWAITAFI